MSKQSAGTLLYRYDPDGVLRVLIVHPSGDYNKHAPWSLPKGEIDPGENLEQTARRETLEETGIQAPMELVSLGSTKYKSGKIVHCFAGLVDQEIKPSIASWEIDKAEFVDMKFAEQRLHNRCIVFLKRLTEHLQNT